MNRKLVADGLIFSASRYVLLALSVVRNLAVASMLGPDDYGFWVILSLIMTYGDQIHFGLRHAGEREIPFWRGQGDAEQALRIAETLYAAMLRVAAVFSILMGLYALLVSDAHPAYRAALFLTGLAVGSDQVSRYFLIILRTRKEFVLSGKVEALFELIRTLLICGLVMVFHLVGAISAVLVTSVVSVAWFHRRFHHEIRPRLDRAALRKTFKAGLPLFFSSALYVLIVSFDRLIGSFILASGPLGIYGLAALIAQLPVNASQAIKDVLYPTVTERFGERGDATAVRSIYGQVMQFSAILIPLMVAVILYVGQLLIVLFLPAYIPSIPLIDVITMGVPFLALAALPMGTMLATGRNATCIGVEITSLIFAATAYLFLLHWPGGSVGVAIGAVVLFSAFGIFSMERTYAIFTSSVTERLSHVARLALPSIFGIALIGCFELIPLLSSRDSVLSALRGSALKTLFFILAFTPFLYVMNKRHGLVRLLFASGGSEAPVMEDRR